MKNMLSRIRESVLAPIVEGFVDAHVLAFALLSAVFGDVSAFIERRPYPR